MGKINRLLLVVANIPLYFIGAAIKKYSSSLMEDTVLAYSVPTLLVLLLMVIFIVRDLRKKKSWSGGSIADVVLALLFISWGAYIIYASCYGWYVLSGDV